MEATAPIYQFDAQQHPTPIGTSVAVKLGSTALLLSAAHVLDHRHARPLHVGIATEFRVVSGEFGRIFAKGVRSVADDHVDVGFVRLAGPDWADVPDSSFLQWPDLDRERPAPRRHAHAVVGFPLSKQRDNVRGSTLESRAFQVALLEADDGRYSELGYDPKVNLVLGFDRKEIWGPDGIHTAPNPIGISGGGAWRFGRHLLQHKEPPKLSGIVIEHHDRGPFKYLLATRLAVVLAGIAELHSDLRRAIERLAGEQPGR